MTGVGSGSGGGGAAAAATSLMMSSRRGGGGGGGGGGSCGGGWVRFCLVMFAVTSALCVSGPALYWKFNLNNNKSFLSTSNNGNSNNNQHQLSSSCPACSCNCPPPPTLLQIAPGLANLSVPDCGSSDPDLKKEMAKQFVDLLTEELKLQEGVAAEHALHMNATLAEARRVASQYQREGDKCIAATETCEGARERSEALLRKEMKLTSLWERRARKLGWEGE